MQERIFGRVRRKIADLPELKQIGYKRNAGGNALASMEKPSGSQNKPTDQIGNSQNDDERRKYPPNPARVELHERKGIGLNLRKNDASDQKAGNNEKNINPDKSAGDKPRLSVITDHQQNGDSSQTIDIRAIGTRLALVTLPSDWQYCVPQLAY